MFTRSFVGPEMCIRASYITTARTGTDTPHPLSGSLLVVPGAGKGLAQPTFAG
ncbi:hypothetical protein PV369_34550 [Streptomyces scabiei]|uniref:hypothetical protein n=1 Tax=Streptomyces scabiei TaxID=1930 RepID=UPI0029A3826C|nr:hypothetical protein [Streptomyces scabiei]MDX3160513.1 hypothetical protein [Streptomyces scabiei]